MPCPNPQTPRSRHSPMLLLRSSFASLLYRWPPAGAFSYGFLALLLLPSCLFLAFRSAGVSPRFCRCLCSAALQGGRFHVFSFCFRLI